MLRRVLTVAAGLTVSLGIGNAQIALGGNGNGNGNANPGVIPPQANAFGNSYAEWVEEWWQWAASLPSDMNPLTDTADCSAGQSGKVWFLGGSFADPTVLGPGAFLSEVDRTCTIPSGTALFFPIVNAACDDRELDPDANLSLEEQEELLRQCVKPLVDQAVDVQATITCNGVETEIEDLDEYRVQSALFTIDPFVDDPGNVLGLTEPTDAVSDGFYLLLAPLSVGTCTLEFGGSFVLPGFTFTLDVTYLLDVVPKGQYDPSE